MAPATDDKELTPEELMKKLGETAKELFNLGLRVGRQRNSGRIRELRRAIARMKTALHQKGIRA